MRTLADINADITATASKLTELEVELKAAYEARRTAVLQDFDAGMSRPDLCAKHAISYATLSNILFKGKRTERYRQALDLKPEARVAYNRLLRQGMRSRLARSIALQVAA